MPKSVYMLSQEALAMKEGCDPYFDAATVRVGLYVDPPEVSDPGLVADFGLPNTSAYPEVAPTAISAPVRRLDDRYTLVISGMAWSGNSIQLPVTFRGCYVKASTGATQIMAWKEFDEPVVFLNAENNVQLMIRLSFSRPDGDVEVTVVNG